MPPPLARSSLITIPAAARAATLRATSNPDASSTARTTAATRISGHLDHHLPSRTTEPAAPAQAETITPIPATVPPAPPPERDPRIDSVLQDAGQLYTSQLASSWVPAYLSKRGIAAAATGEWHIGYAPRGWTTLTSYLRDRGHHDDTIQAAGLARLSSRGTLIDHFRDRLMLPVHDEQGNLAGFTGRAHRGTDPSVPKYLNGPATSAYQKGDLLFGLHNARDHLARSATPVIVEGPFDAIAVTLADPHHYAGLAPCGTALTTRQAAALSRATNLLVAFDDDPAGRKAAIRAYGILRPVSDRLQSVTLPGKDPAEILQTGGSGSAADDPPEPRPAAVRDHHRRAHRPIGTTAARPRRAPAGHAQHRRPHRQPAAARNRRSDPPDHPGQPGRLPVQNPTPFSTERTMAQPGNPGTQHEADETPAILLRKPPPNFHDYPVS